MTHGLRRGSTVAYGPHFGVAWAIGAAGFGAPAHHRTGLPPGPAIELHPIFFTVRRPQASDVALDLAELLAAGIKRAGAVIRVSSAKLHAPDSLRLVGELRGTALCRYVRGVCLAGEDAAVIARYQSRDRHRRDHAEPVPVKMHD